MMQLLSTTPFKATELPQLYWKVPTALFSDNSITPRQMEAFTCIVELPNGWKAKVSQIRHQGECDGHTKEQFMGFVEEMWGEIGKTDVRDGKV
jgi:hypothetical protein